MQKQLRPSRCLTDPNLPERVWLCNGIGIEPSMQQRSHAADRVAISPRLQRTHRTNPQIGRHMPQMPPCAGVGAIDELADG